MPWNSDWLVEELGTPAGKTVEDIPDYLIRTSIEEDQGEPLFHPLALESSGDGLATLDARNLVKKDLALGAGGAILAHAFIAIAFSFMALVKPLPHFHEPFIRVYLTSEERTGHSSGDTTGSSSDDMRDNTEKSEKPVSHQAQPVPDDPKVPKPDSREMTKPAATSIPKSPEVKKTAKRSATRHEPRHETSRADARQDTAATEETIQPDAGAGSPSERQGKAIGGEHETGESPGVSRGAGPPAGSGISGEFDISRVDQVPRVLKKIEPVYPGRARTLEICGKVVVRFLVEPDGRVSKPSVVEAHPAGYFEQSTLDAIRQWRFKPGSFRGHTVATWVTLPVQFRLTGQD